MCNAATKDRHTADMGEKEKLRRANSSLAQELADRIIAYVRGAEKLGCEGGLEFVNLGPAPEQGAALWPGPSVTEDPRRDVGRRASAMAAKFTDMEAGMYPPLAAHLENVDPYDCIVTDHATLAAYDAAEHKQVPLVVLFQSPLSYALAQSGNHKYNGPSHVPVEILTEVLPVRMHLLQRWLLNPILKHQAAKASDAALAAPRARVRRALGLPGPPGVAMSVPAAVPRCLTLVSGDWALAGEAVVYMALGSLVIPTREQVAELAAALASMEGMRFAAQALLPEGWAEKHATRILVLGWAPQAAILAHPAVRLFVTHGGLNSLYEGLLAGKPLVVMPYFSDQHINAQHAVNVGVGMAVDPMAADVAKHLPNAVATLLAPDSTASATAAALGEKLRRRVGSQDAAQAVADFLAVQASS
ncbi:hypothetical protein JKP88DRAFT_333412 [Tribonema minus]|uniref:UDP-glucuronosyltransferase n=1 Tax=Tribonema minus TaxID=303371 RepID=A0A835YL01_9STRA|nr:hypothetical protein JKP88DRAFT_333412 [Tribonema minus]